MTMKMHRIVSILIYAISGLLTSLGLIVFYKNYLGFSRDLFMHDFRYGTTNVRTVIWIILIVFVVVIPIICIATDSHIRSSWSVKIAGKIRMVTLPVLAGRVARITIYFFGIISILYIAFEGISGVNASEKQTWQGDMFIAHAGGKLGDYYYSNCKEAIETNYEKGFRCFEIDFILTKDDQLVCRHDWDYQVQRDIESGNIVNLETFLNAPIFNVYTPISSSGLLDLMETYPDIYIITDTKYTDEDSIRKEFDSLLLQASGREYLLDRFIIQIYNNDMYFTVYNIYPFKNWIYTLYQVWDGSDSNFEQYARFCCDHNIGAITCWNHFANQTIVNTVNEYGLKLYVHTENDIEKARELYALGVDGFYTDELDPGDFQEDY